MEKLASEQCVPCKGNVPPLTEAEINRLHLNTPMWQVIEVASIKRLRRRFDFDHYEDGLVFTMRIGRLAQEQDHHPTLITRYDSVTVEWYTHSIKGLHRNDFIMAAKTDAEYLALLDEQRTKNVVQEASEESFPASDSPGWIGRG